MTFVVDFDAPDQFDVDFDNAERFAVEFDELDQFSVEFEGSEERFPVEFAEMIPVEVDREHEHYSGAYDITPKVTAQEMKTKDKIMDDDVAIRAIPFYEISNLSGKTVYIGSSLNGDQ